LVNLAKINFLDWLCESVICGVAVAGTWEIICGYWAVNKMLEKIELYGSSLLFLLVLPRFCNQFLFFFITRTSVSSLAHRLLLISSYFTQSSWISNGHNESLEKRIFFEVAISYCTRASEPSWSFGYLGPSLGVWVCTCHCVPLLDRRIFDGMKHRSNGQK
jgi:hypothetical protein